MPSILVLLLLATHAHGITSGVGPWKIDKSQLAYSYSTQDSAASFHNQRYVPLHTVRSPTLAPVSYGFKPLVRTAPNVVLIQPRGIPYKGHSLGVVYGTAKPPQPKYSSVIEQGPTYDGGPPASFPSPTPSFASPTASNELYSTIQGSSHPPSFSTLSPPKASPTQLYSPPKPTPSETYGPPKPAPSQSYGPPKPPRDTYGPPKVHPRETYGPPKAHPSDTYGPPTGTFGPPAGKPYDVADIEYGPQYSSYGPPGLPDYGPQAPKDEIKFIIYKPENEEIIKDTLIDHARQAGEQIKFLHGPNLSIKHDQKVYLPPPKKSIIYILLKEPEIHTKVQVLGGNDEGAKPEVFIIYETTDGVIRKHYDLTDEESQRVVKALGDKMRLTRGFDEEAHASDSEEITVSPVTSSTTTPSTDKH